MPGYGLSVWFPGSEDRLRHPGIKAFQLGLAAGATRPDLESRMRGHVLGRGELVATYPRG